MAGLALFAVYAVLRTAGPRVVRANMIKYQRVITAAILLYFTVIFIAVIILVIVRGH